MKILDKSKVLVIFSGGQDSTACLGWSIKRWGAKNILALTFDYGQRHKVEIDVARDIAARLEVQHSVFSFDLFANLCDSTLVKEGTPLDENTEDIPTTFVPGRNIMFLTIASAIAYKNNIANIVIGVSSVDYSGYPDCRPDFIDSMADSLAKGLEANIKIHAPLQFKSKTETFLLAEECGVLAETLESHTCYAGVRDVKQSWGWGCGTCPACKLREKGYNDFIALRLNNMERFVVDVQKQTGFNDMDIDKVGVSDVCYPIEVLDKRWKKQGTTASINMYVDLPRHFRGTHMSRFIEVLNQWQGEITVRNIGQILQMIAASLEARSAHMELVFKYFIEKEAPVSKAKSLMGYECRFIASHDRDGIDDFILQVKVPVMNLCPCSKEISNTAAHNQRSEVSVRLRFTDFVWIEEVIEMVEQSASCELYSLLKREDEKYVSEKAYENPRFVEDIVRIIAEKFMQDDRITWFSVRSKNYESIHNHNAFALIERNKQINKQVIA